MGPGKKRVMISEEEEKERGGIVNREFTNENGFSYITEAMQTSS